MAPRRIIQRYGFSTPVSVALQDGWSIDVTPSFDWFKESDAKTSDSLVRGATATAVANGQLEIEHSSGNSFRKEHFDLAPFFGANLVFRFRPETLIQPRRPPQRRNSHPVNPRQTMNSSPLKRTLFTAAASAVALACQTVNAGGISLYEVGTPDVGLAAAGQSARAQDAATILTNPAGMTPLAGNQLMLGAQVLRADLNLSIGPGTSPALGSGDGGNPIGSFPGGGLFYTHSLSPDLKLGLGVTGNFGSVVEYDEGWVGRYRAQEGTLLGVSILPSIAARVDEHLSLGASLNVMYGKLDNKVAVNNILGADGRLSVDDTAWGFGANLGLLYELDQGTRFGITYTSPVKLNFKARPQWDGLSPGIQALLASRGLLDARLDLGVTVPQGVNAGFYRELDSRWALLGSVGWQQWSKFGEVEVGVDSNDPLALTTRLDFKDTWHLSGGAQYKWSDAWLLNAGIAYDSGFQDKNRVALPLPVNAAWRFGVGGQNTASPSFNWGWSLEYLTGGNLGANATSNVPVAVGGRGSVVGTFNDVRYLFLAVNFNWKS